MSFSFVTRFAGFLRVSFVVCLSQYAFAIAVDAQRRQSHAQERVPSCADYGVNLRRVPAGFRCRTSKGKIFERVSRSDFGEAWRDSTGVIWSDLLGEASNDGPIQSLLVVNSEATRICSSAGGTLPTRAEFESGLRQGFEEVLPNLETKQDRWYWSRSAHPSDPDSGFYYSSYYGDIFAVFRDYSGSVRCVAR
jgi:hypothetical protein